MRWSEAVVEIVKSFNKAGRPGFALTFLILLVTLGAVALYVGVRSPILIAQIMKL